MSTLEDAKLRMAEADLWARALELMPRGTQTMSKCPDQFVDGVYPTFASSAHGAYIYAEDGRRYLDYMGGLGPIILGYNNPVINRAIEIQLHKGTIFSLPTTLEADVAQLIVETVPSAEMVRFGKNGSDVTLAAVRIARSYTGRESIAKCGYHGWGDWHAITLRPYGVPKDLASIVHEFNYNDLDHLEWVLRQNSCAAIIMEPACLIRPEDGYLQGVRDLASKYGALLIFDEIVSGYRWSLGGAQAKYGVEPDLTCLGKALANGLPLSAIAGKREFMKELDHVFFSMTFGGECLSLAAAKATISELKEKDYDHIWYLGTRLRAGIKAAAKRNGLEIDLEGMPPRMRLDFPPLYSDPEGLRALFYQGMVDQSILFPNVIYVNFAHTSEDIDKTIVAADESFKIVKENLRNPDRVLRGKRSVSIFTRQKEKERE